MTDEFKRLGQTLAEANRTRSALPAVDFAAIQTHADAMVTQAATLDAMGWQVKGWKVAIRPDGASVAAPLNMVDATGIPQRGKAIEVEICYTLKVGLPPRATPYTAEEVRAAISSINIGIELLDFRLHERSTGPFPTFLADRLGNTGFILGPKPSAATLAREANPDTAAPWPQLRVQLDGETKFDAASLHPFGHALTPLLAYANAQNDLAGGLKAGHVVTTGSLCGAIPTSGTGHFSIDWDGVRFEVVLTD